MTDKIASGVAYASSVGLVFFGMELSDIALLGGLIIGVLTYLTNLYFKYRMRVQDAEYKREMLKLLKEKNSVLVSPQQPEDDD